MAHLSCGGEKEQKDQARLSHVAARTGKKTTKGEKKEQKNPNQIKREAGVVTSGLGVMQGNMLTVG